MMVMTPASVYLRYPLKMARWVVNGYLGFIINTFHLIKADIIADDLKLGLDNFNQTMKEWIGK